MFTREFKKSNRLLGTVGKLDGAGRGSDLASVASPRRQAKEPAVAEKPPTSVKLLATFDRRALNGFPPGERHGTNLWA